jgi:hypothetical protein
MLRLIKQIVIDVAFDTLVGDIRTIYQTFHPKHVREREFYEHLNQRCKEGKQ